MVNRVVLAWLLCVSACLVDCNRETAVTEPNLPKVDTAVGRKDSVDVHKDSIDARKDSIDAHDDSIAILKDSLEALKAKGMIRLAASVTSLPMPMGTRYFNKPAFKKSACQGGQDIYKIPANPGGFFGIDSISYIDSKGVGHCAPEGITLGETHNRYLFDTASGEVWELIRIEITPDPLLTRYHSRGTGRIRLLSGLVANIESYEVDMVMDHSTETPIFRNAHLWFTVPDGHSLRLELVRPHPFRAPDFFPLWDDPPRGDPVMAGPVLSGADTVGRAALYGDRTLGFWDAAGKPIPAK
ncbi:MAG TPA: hypothetical protein VK465_18160 [Fibrobacteria bacterium]|nr:hypothetical protein [Fibrobacteria bacterium]